MKIDVLGCRGGSMFQKTRTRELVREKRGPARHVTESRRIKSPWGDEAHCRLGAVGAVEFVSRNRPKCLKDFLRKRIGTLKIKARQRQKEPENWRSSLKEARQRMRGKLSLPPLAHMLHELEMGEARMGEAIRQRLPHSRFSSRAGCVPSKGMPRC